MTIFHISDLCKIPQIIFSGWRVAFKVSAEGRNDFAVYRLGTISDLIDDRCHDVAGLMFCLLRPAFCLAGRRDWHSRRLVSRHTRNGRQAKRRSTGNQRLCLAKRGADKIRQCGLSIKPENLPILRTGKFLPGLDQVFRSSRHSAHSIRRSRLI